MEIKVEKNNTMKHYDTGGGTREISAIITIDENMSPRMQRKNALVEGLGCCLGYVLDEDQIVDIAEVCLDVLDQLEPVREE